MTLDTDRQMDARPGVLGIDIGGVVIDRVNDVADTSFVGGRHLETAAVPGTIEALSRLVEERFGPDVHLISRCSPEAERKTREWLDHHNVFARTGINESHLHFCRERLETAPIAEWLELTHFVDDRLEVLGYLKTVPHKYLFRAAEEEVVRHRWHLDTVIPVERWDDVTGLLLA